MRNVAISNPVPGVSISMPWEYWEFIRSCGSDELVQVDSSMNVVTIAPETLLSKLKAHTFAV